MLLRNVLRALRRSVGAWQAQQLITLTALGLLVFGIGALFHPGVQKRLVLKYIAPSLEQLSVERLHILPWSVEIIDLEVGFGGGQFAADRLSL